MGDEIYAKAAKALGKPESKIRKDCGGIRFTQNADTITVHGTSGHDYTIIK